jgi:hypothetical protein
LQVVNRYFTNTTYAVARVSAFSPAAAWYFLFYLYFVFARYERRNEIQKKKKYRYKFLIDGSDWMPDPANPLRIADGFGGWNSMLEI